MTGLNLQIIQLSVALKDRFGPMLSGFFVLLSKLFTSARVREGYLRYDTRWSEFSDCDETGGLLCAGAALSSAHCLRLPGDSTKLRRALVPVALCNSRN